MKPSWLSSFLILALFGLLPTGAPAQPVSNLVTYTDDAGGVQLDLSRDWVVQEMGYRDGHAWRDAIAASLTETGRHPGTIELNEMHLQLAHGHDLNYYANRRYDEIRRRYSASPLAGGVREIGDRKDHFKLTGYGTQMIDRSPAKWFSYVGITQDDNGVRYQEGVDYVLSAKGKVYYLNAVGDYIQFEQYKDEILHAILQAKVGRAAED